MRKQEDILSHPPIDQIELRRAFGTFVTGVTVVTTRDDKGLPWGMTANSFTSVSLDPPLVLVCIGKKASSFPAFERSSSFVVNILHEGQGEYSRLFASKSPNKFQDVGYDSVHTGSPVLSDSLSWFDCSIFNRMDAGDHLILIGQVKAFGTSPAAPLGFCRGKYARIKDALPEGWIPSQRMTVGYLIEHDGRILLRSDGKGRYLLPFSTEPKIGSRIDLAGGNMIAVVPETSFLYSVFDVADGDPGYIVYRASLASDCGQVEDSEDLKFFPINELPFDAIATRDLTAVLRRYVRERGEKRFGIYINNLDSDRIALLEADLSARATHPGLRDHT